MTHVPPADDHFSRYLVPASSRSAGGIRARGKTDVIPIAKIPDISPAKPGQFDRAFRRGVDFLLKTQNKDGSWGDHRVIGTWNILCPYPDGPLTFKTASTALCIAGLNASPLHHEPAVQEAMTRAEDYLIRTMHHLKRGDALCVYNTWAHTYVLDAMSMRAARLAPDSLRYRELKECARSQVKNLMNWLPPWGAGATSLIPASANALRHSPPLS